MNFIGYETYDRRGEAGVSQRSSLACSSAATISHCSQAAHTNGGMTD